MNGYITINGKKHKVGIPTVVVFLAAVLSLYAVVSALPIMWITGASFGKSFFAAYIVAFICKLDVKMDK